MELITHDGNLWRVDYTPFASGKVGHFLHPFDPGPLIVFIQPNAAKCPLTLFFAWKWNRVSLCHYSTFIFIAESLLMCHLMLPLGWTWWQVVHMFHSPRGFSEGGSSAICSFDRPVNLRVLYLRTNTQRRRVRCRWSRLGIANGISALQLSHRQSWNSSDIVHQ